MQALGIDRHSEAVERTGTWGFKPPRGKSLEVTSSVDGIMAFVQHWDNARHDLDFAIDGIVIVHIHSTRARTTRRSPALWRLSDFHDRSWRPDSSQSAGLFLRLGFIHHIQSTPPSPQTPS